MFTNSSNVVIKIVTFQILFDSVTAYPILNDALKTGELDYINGGTEQHIDMLALILNVFFFAIKLNNTV